MPSVLWAAVTLADLGSVGMGVTARLTCAFACASRRPLDQPRKSQQDQAITVAGYTKLVRLLEYSGSSSWALNSAVECHPHTVEVVGSNPTAPTIASLRMRWNHRQQVCHRTTTGRWYGQPSHNLLPAHLAPHPCHGKTALIDGIAAVGRADHVRPAMLERMVNLAWPPLGQRSPVRGENL